MAHPQTNFSSNFQGVDPPLEGYWHDDPIPCGGGNVVTDIWPNPAGVPVVVKGFNALTAEDIADKLDKTGNASNTTSTFTKASGDTSSITSGSKLSVIFTAISSFFASLKALAFKDKASYNDLSSGVQSSLDKADSALQSHQDISGKADKVSNAANGDLAALDANGNLTDSGKKAADFAVSSVYNETDPRNLRSFIKCEGSGTQFYRKLATSLDVNDAGNSSVIKLEGCVGAWGSGDTTDFSIVFRTRGSVLFEASVFKRIGSNNAFDKVNFELYEESNGMYSLWLNSSGAYTKCAINAFAYGGAYIVYDGTNGTPTGTLVASASQNYKVMMVTDGDGSDVSVTPDGTSTGYDLGSSTTLKAFAQKFKNLVSVLKALAFKDKASYNDLSGGVQSSLDKADSALQSHQSVTDNNPTLSWGTASKVGKVGSTDLQVTMPANPAQNLPASVITSGTFDTDRIADDAITADKVKDNETLPVNISGTAKHLDCYGFWHTYGTGYYDPSKPYALIGEVNLNISGNTGAGHLLQFELDSEIYARIRLDIKWSNGLLERANVLIIDSSVDYSTLKDLIKITHFTFTSDGNTFLCIRLYVKFTGDWQVWRVRQLDCQTGDCGYTNWADFPLRVGYGSQYAAEYGTLATYKFSYPYANGQVGSPSTPVYVDSNGQVQPCTQGATLKSNTATLYISGYYNTLPVYHVKDIKNGCVNYVHVKDTSSSNCNLRIEAPALAADEEYDYVVVFDTFTNNHLVGDIVVENCETTGHFESGVFVHDAMTISSAAPSQVPMIIVTGNVARPQWYDRV